MQLTGNLPEIESPTQENDAASQPAVSQPPSPPLLQETSTVSQPEMSKTQQHKNPNKKLVSVAKNQHFNSQKFGRKRNNFDVDQEYLPVEKRKLQLYESRSTDKSAEDPDRNFLLSSLPYLKEVPGKRKISVCIFSILKRAYH